MKAGKAAGPRPTVKDKMRSAYEGMIADERRKIGAEPAPKGKCPCGCK